jgi:hypothetical protein
MALMIANEPVLADEQELLRLQELAEHLEAAPAVILIGADSEPIPLPESAYRVLAGIVRTLANGDGVAVTSIDAELTPLQAANMLNIPRASLIALLESGELPSAQPDAIRPVRLVDLLAYRQRRSKLRQELLGEMLRDAEELGLYDKDYPPPPESDEQ